MKRRSISAVALIATAVALLINNPAMAAGSATATFEARLIIKADCKFTSAVGPALDFGSKGLLDTAISQSTTLEVECSNTTPYSIALNAGSVAGSTTAERLMLGSDAATKIKYQLYQDAAHTVVWGDTKNSDTLDKTGNGIAQSYTVYGNVPVQDTPAPGTYESLVTATITF